MSYSTTYDFNLLLQRICNHSTSEDVICDTARKLLVIGDEQAIKPILERLEQHSDPPGVRKELITALAGSCQSSKILPAVVNCLMADLTSENTSDEVRAAAAFALGILGVFSAGDALISTLKSAMLKGDPCLILACVDALGRIRDFRAIPIYMQILDSDIPGVKSFTAETLGRFGMSARESVPALWKLAKSGDVTETRSAREAITKIKGRCHTAELRMY